MRAVLEVLPPEGATVAELTDAIYGKHKPVKVRGRYETWTDRNTHRGAVRRAVYALGRRGEVELEVLPFKTYPLEGTGDPHPYLKSRPANSLLVRRPSRPRSWNPAEAVEAVQWRVHGRRARYEPNLSVADHVPDRPHAWVLLDGDGSYCAHRRERWHRPLLTR
jgi:hypothetical protein